MSKYERSDRFETKDSRDRGRIIEIDAELGLSEDGERIIRQYEDGYYSWEDHGYLSLEQAVEVVRQKNTYYSAHTEVNPRNPEREGRKSTLSEFTLANRYHKISR